MVLFAKTVGGFQSLTIFAKSSILNVWQGSGYASTPQETEAVAQRYSVKKVFLEVSQNSQENTCARVSFLIKLQACGTGVFL